MIVRETVTKVKRRDEMRVNISGITFGEADFVGRVPFQSILYNGAEIGATYPRGNTSNFLEPVEEVFQFGISEEDLEPYVDKVKSYYSDVDAWHFVQASSIEEFIKFYNIIYGGVK